MTRAAEAIEKLLGIMARLRGPDGCPWDREQTLQTLRPYVLEETYEVLEAIEGGDSREHCEELGDRLAGADRRPALPRLRRRLLLREVLVHHRGRGHLPPSGCGGEHGHDHQACRDAEPHADSGC